MRGPAIQPGNASMFSVVLNDFEEYGGRFLFRINSNEKVFSRFLNYNIFTANEINIHSYLQ